MGFHCKHYRILIKTPTSDSVSFAEEDTPPIVYYSDTDTPPRTLSCDTTDDKLVAKQWFKNGLVWNKGPYHETDLSSGKDFLRSVLYHRFLSFLF